MPVHAWRLQGLKRLADNGLPVLFQRGLDSAAAQYAGDCPDKYFLFVDECLHAYKANPCSDVQKIVRASSQPLPLLLSPGNEDPLHNQTQASDPKHDTSSSLSSMQEKEDDDDNDEQAALAQQQQQRRVSRLRRRDPRTLCPRCKSTQHITMPDEKQERSADEGATPYRKCKNPDCGYRWCTIREQM